MEVIKRISSFIGMLRQFLVVDNGGKQGVAKSVFISICSDRLFEIGQDGGIDGPP